MAAFNSSHFKTLAACLLAAWGMDLSADMGSAAPQVLRPAVVQPPASANDSDQNSNEDKAKANDATSSAAPATLEPATPGLMDPSMMPPPQQPPPKTPFNPSPILEAISQILGGGGGTMGDEGSALLNGYTTSSPGISQAGTDGKVEPCNAVPSQVQKAVTEAMEFRNKCTLAQTGDDKKILINDFSTNNTPYMYIFDLSGKCLGRTGVSYGNGVGRVSPTPCSDKNSHLTPPGFHLTGVHNGAKYNDSNSLAMIGLEGQGSVDRGVVIHPSSRPGTASTWGCAGIGAFNQVRQMLGSRGYGSLVYNYFGSKGTAGGCRNRSGMGPHNFCRKDGNSSGMSFSPTGSSPVNR